MFDTIDWDAAFRWSAIVILVGISVIVYLGTLWFVYKYKTGTKTKKIDPIFKGVIATFSAIIIVGTLEITGLINPGTTKKAMPFFFLVFIATILIYWIVGRPRKPLTARKQLMYMMNYAGEHYNAKVTHSLSYTPYLIVFKETYDAVSDTIIGNAVLELRADDRNLHKYLIRINGYDGRLIMIMENPPLIEQHRLTGERLATKSEESPYRAFNDYENESLVNNEQKENE